MNTHIFALLLSGGLALLSCYAVEVEQQKADQPTAHGERLTSPEHVAHDDFNYYILTAYRQMPQKGGYSVKAPAAKNLATKAVVWDGEKGKLHVNIAQAKPSFCSAACYIMLLHALKLWERETHSSLSSDAWKMMDIKYGLPDGKMVWGRANANGPSYAKLIHDIDAGESFTNINDARAGDFLKFFWTEEIGAKERGHMVVFLGTEQKEGKTCIRYWSSNVPDGYSERVVPIEKMHHLIFTRISRPGNFARVTKLPTLDSWLGDMLKKSCSFDEACKVCGIILSGTNSGIVQATESLQGKSEFKPRGEKR